LVNNRPREALQWLSSVDPERGFFRGFHSYWHYLTEAHHNLGNYEEELEQARRARKLFPESLDCLSYEVRALIALGRLDQVECILAEVAASPPGGTSPGELMVMASREYLAQGFPENARKAAEQAVVWFTSRPAEQASQPSLIQALFLAERLEEARAQLELLSSIYPDNLTYRGYLGVIAARTGDQEQAGRMLEWFEQVNRPYLFGSQFSWRSAIAAWQGRREEALRLFREAMAGGRPFGWPQLHPLADPVLQPLWDDPTFLQLIEPRG
jgi:tetratricopeptide (TPR) repeat protein